MKTSKISGVSRLTQILWRVRLECGHPTSVTREELDRQQLFIGKAVECVEYTQQERKEQGKTIHEITIDSHRGQAA